MQRPVLAANWKMHYGPPETRAYLERFIAAFPMGCECDRSLIFFPPAVSIAAAAHALRDRPEMLVGVQNIHWQERGAFTGETSAIMAREAGARVALVGHSERRQYFGETDEMAARKCAAACAAELTPMLCVGETLGEREAGATLAVVLRQLAIGTSALDPDRIASMLIAYEPVWAIGTGWTARPEDATVVHAAIREALGELIGERAGVVPILYGGSVSADNAAALLAAPEIDGLLVGGASLDAERWARIART